MYFPAVEQLEDVACSLGVCFLRPGLGFGCVNTTAWHQCGQEGGQAYHLVADSHAHDSPTLRWFGLRALLNLNLNT